MNITAELEIQLQNDIDVFGWHVIKVPEDEHGPALSYSIGLFHTFEHPEIIIVGLELEASHYLINRIGDAIREGISFQPGQFYSNLIEGVDCYFTAVDQLFYKEFASHAQAFYKEATFPILQCIYPTISGIYPWQSEWPVALNNKQPVLGSVPNAG